jgi:hypothetical protein
MRGLQQPEVARRARRRESADGDAAHWLTLQGGRWVLETSRLVAIDRDVMRQEQQRIVGADAVLDHLRRLEQGRQLAQGAADLMRASHDQESPCFGAFDGAWLPVETRQAAAPDELESLDELKQQFAELRAELLVLRASHQRLRQRVAELEKVRHLGPALERERGRELARDREPATRSLRFGQPRAVERPAPEPLPRVQAADATLTPATVASAEAPALEPTPAAPGPMGLAPRAELVECLQNLLGSEHDFVANAQKLPELSPAFFVSKLFDDAKQEVGCFVLDSRGTAELGGTLLGVPAPAIEEQATSGAPSEDCLSAASEVCNNLSGVVNRAGCHITAGPLSPWTEGALPWLSNWSQRAVTLATQGGGRLWLLAR